MSKSAASESNEHNKSQEMSGKRGEEDELNDNEEGILKIPLAESLSISTVVSTVSATTDHLVNVHLLHTNLQELDDEAFGACSELKLMTIPDSLQKFGDGVFVRCFKLVPSNIDVIDDSYDDSTSEVFAHLCSQQT
ncbi:hypothetical protein TrLO_g12516 [Triparma laevis f. longispina]|uniref:Uncharacterized protein n=1 Tax=Triparma laevis f. longispina TaxID=1714387 RepID=A0A9W7FMH3_9STRA|nr:hypothetical protein TrLO_g12516 [Triparma laevis f. longispina]